MNIVDLISKIAFAGGEWVLWLLIVCSIGSIGVIVERFIYFRKRRTNVFDYVKELTMRLNNGDIEGAIYLSKFGSSTYRVNEVNSKEFKKELKTSHSAVETLIQKNNINRDLSNLSNEILTDILNQLLENPDLYNDLREQLSSDFESENKILLETIKGEMNTENEVTNSRIRHINKAILRDIYPRTLAKTPKHVSGMEAKVALAGLENYEKGQSAVEEIMLGKRINEKIAFEKNLIVLATLGNNAPFIGLLGTVLGIIRAFRDLALSGTAGPSVVMQGISEALVATAVGLFVAIPAVVAYNYFQRNIKETDSATETISRVMFAHLKYKKEKEDALRCPYFGNRGEGNNAKQ